VRMTDARWAEGKCGVEDAEVPPKEVIFLSAVIPRVARRIKNSIDKWNSRKYRRDTRDSGLRRRKGMHLPAYGLRGCAKRKSNVMWMHFSACLVVTCLSRCTKGSKDGFKFASQP